MFPFAEEFKGIPLVFGRVERKTAPVYEAESIRELFAPEPASGAFGKKTAQDGHFPDNFVRGSWRIERASETQRLFATSGTDRGLEGFKGGQDAAPEHFDFPRDD